MITLPWLALPCLVDVFQPVVFQFLFQVSPYNDSQNPCNLKCEQFRNKKEPKYCLLFLQISFSKSLIIQEEKPNEVTTVKEIWIRDLNNHKIL